MDSAADRVRDIVLEALPPSQRSLAADDLLTLHGMDSLMATEIAGRITDTFGLPVPLTIAFECPTLAALSARVTQLLRQAERQPTGVLAFRRTPGGRA